MDSKLTLLNKKTARMNLEDEGDWEVKEEKATPTFRKVMLLAYLDYAKIGCFHDIGIMKEEYGEYLKTKSTPRNEVLRVIVNHEHRKLEEGEAAKPTCHFQFFLKFKTQKDGSSTMFNWTKEGKTYQAWLTTDKIRSEEGAANYCKKEETRQDTASYEYVSPNDAILKAERKETNPVALLLSKMVDERISNDAEIFAELEQMKSSSQIIGIINTLDKLKKFVEGVQSCREEEEEKLNTGLVTQDFVHPLIRKWFAEEFGKAGRKKCLVVYGARGTAKTTFFLNVFNRESHLNPAIVPEKVSAIVYHNGKLDGNQYKRKPKAKMVILDDVEKVNGDDVTTHKGLLTGQPEILGTKWFLGEVPALPCVLLTNDYEGIYLAMLRAADWKYDCYFVELKEGEALAPPKARKEISAARKEVITNTSANLFN